MATSGKKVANRLTGVGKPAGLVDGGAIEALFAWMCDGAPPSADGRKIVAQVCEKLRAAGVPVDRFALFLMTIHPTIKGRRLSWTQADGATIREAGFAVFDTDEYHHNPLPHVSKTRQPVRRRLIDPDCPHDYIIVDELIADGFTDYLVQPVIYVDGEVHTMSWSTKDDNGFSEDGIAALERIRPALTRLVESYVLRLNAANIISTYVGRNAGEQVLRGKIKRGDAEFFSAIIMFADLKNYTALSNSAEAETVFETLNQFFDALEEPIVANGGEILKFMGDGLLAIFPLKEESREAAAVAAVAASDAVGQARRNLDGIQGHPGFRSALHAGSLHYGNIGASRRLDFTAIGPQVNLTARLLGAAASIGCDDVCSGYIGQLLEGRYAPHSEIEVKGYSEKQSVFSRLPESSR